MPKRKSEDDDEWARHKEDILRIYMTEDKSLMDVMHILASRGFKRTKPQYERIFKEWGASKNVREEEWKFIFTRLEERQRMFKGSVVNVRGALISESKLKKQKTKLRQKIFDQCLERRLPRAKTPQGIEITTPPSSPLRKFEDGFSTVTDASSGTMINIHGAVQVPSSGSEIVLSCEQIEELEGTMSSTNIPAPQPANESSQNHPTNISEGSKWKDLFALGDAILRGDTALLWDLLHEANLPGGNLLPQHGVRALLLAASHREIINKLLLAGADPFGRIDPIQGHLYYFDDYHKLNPSLSPFERAVAVGNLDVAEIFLKQPRDLSDTEQELKVGKQLGASYTLAVYTNNTKLATFLSMHIPSSEMTYITLELQELQKQPYHALQKAARSRDTAEVERLLEAGASPNSLTQDSTVLLTPLRYALIHENFAMVEKLVEAGADVNQRPYCIRGRTPLQMAAANGHLEIVILLINAGADIKARPAAYDGRTTLEAAAEQGHLHVASYLYAQAADIGGRADIQYRRSLYRAYIKGHQTMVDTLQAWRMARYGLHGIVLDIMDCVTEEELIFFDEEAKMEYEAFRQSSK